MDEIIRNDLIRITPDAFVRLNKAADLLNLVRNRESFIDTIAALASSTHLKDRLRFEIRDVDAHLIAAAKAVRSAHAAVAKLTPRQRAQLGVIIDGGLG
jgi:hypothetical protein